MTETRNNIRQDWLSVPRRREEERLDPHVYKRGINGLTVEEALRRAFPRVIDILRRSGEEYSEFEQQLVRQTVRACLISQVSRANLYRIAGILVADRRDEGAHIDTSLALAEVLFDEYGHLDPEETHPALYRRFLGALGIDKDEWEEPPTLPEIEMYITTHYALSGHPDFRLGLGALGPASEWPVPPIYARLSDGLRRAAGLPDEALEIFTSHVTMDVTHARIMMDAIAPYAGDEEGQRRVHEGAMRSLDARSVMLGGLYRAVYREPVPLFDAPSVRLTGE